MVILPDFDKSDVVDDLYNMYNSPMSSPGTLHSALGLDKEVAKEMDKEEENKKEQRERRKRKNRG